MNTVVVIFALVAGVWAATLPESEKTFLKKIHDSCQANPSTYADEDLLRNMNHHSHNPKVMAHMLCMAQGTGMMTESGTMDMGVIRSKMTMMMHDHNMVELMMNKCAIQKESPMEAAMDMWMCFMQNNIGYMHMM